MMTAATLDNTVTATAHVREVDFRDTLVSEWIKLRTLRSTYITLGLGFSLSVAASGLFALAVGNTYDGWSDAQKATFEPLMFAMVGNVIALIVATVFGVMTVSGEYANGMVRQSVIATPRRAQVLWAKVLLVLAITMAFGIATVMGMFLAGQAVLGAYGLPTTSLEDPDALRLVIGLGAATPLFPVIGLTLGFMLRSTAAAITATLGLLWLPLVFTDMLPTWAQENVLSLLPGQAADSFTIAHAIQSPTDSPPLVGVVLVIVWLTLFIGSAQVLLRRRDV